MNVSPERLAANRANAQKSTGPKTLEGRAASRMNALKHGLLSQEVLISSPHRQESEAELFALHDWFKAELQPMGPIETLLVDQIVTTHWRLRRVLAAESAEMALSLRRGRSSSNPLAEGRSVEACGKTYEIAPAWEETAEGCQKAQRELRKIASAVEREGGVTEGILGDKSLSLLTVIQDLRAMLNRRKTNPDGVEEKAWAEQHLTEALEYLDTKLQEFTLLEEEHYTAALMPSVEVLDKFGRYETMLNRQLNRAITQLAKLQKERREKQKAEMGKVETARGDKCRSENLPNEASGEKQTAETGKAERTPKSESRSENLPNEPIPAAEPSEISNFRSQIEELRNEPISEGVK